MKVRIDNRLVGDKEPTFIIAEAGVNHNGDIKLAKQLIDRAKDAGVDAVKFQTFKADGVVTKDAGIADYAKKNIGRDIKQIEMIKKLALEYNDFKVLKNYCDHKKIIFLSTPHSFDAIDFLECLVPAYKFGSGDITNIPALKHAAKKGKPIILGTGMSTINEVKKAINTIRSEGNKQIIALHCTTRYPCPLEEVNLRAMTTMQKELNCLLGYSDHTLGIIVPVMAVSMGAVVIEKHFTIDRNLSGPDHKASLIPDELKNMVKEIRKVEKILGNSDKKPTESEKKIMKLVRKSIVAKINIPEGSKIRRDTVVLKRPGTGLEPKMLETIIGRAASKDITKDEVITGDMIDWKE